MTDDFERRLVESLRYGAGQVTPVAEPLVVERDKGRSEPRRAPRRSLVVVAVGLLALLVLSVPAAVRGRQQVGSGLGPIGQYAVGQEAGHPLPPWQLSAGLYRDHGGVHPIHASEVTVGPGGFAYLIATVAPANPDGKTYLQAWQPGGGWVVLGPHELDGISQVAYLLWPRGSASEVTYRVYVPGSGQYGDAFSAPVTVRIQR
jgi:hypothetical protein